MNKLTKETSTILDSVEKQLHLFEVLKNLLFIDLLNKMYIYISLQIILYGNYIFLVLGTAFLILLINKYVDWSIEKSYLDESAMEADSDK